MRTHIILFVDAAAYTLNKNKLYTHAHSIHKYKHTVHQFRYTQYVWLAVGLPLLLLLFFRSFSKSEYVCVCLYTIIAAVVRKKCGDKCAYIYMQTSVKKRVHKCEQHFCMCVLMLLCIRSRLLLRICCIEKSKRPFGLNEVTSYLCAFSTKQFYFIFSLRILKNKYNIQFKFKI